MEPLIHKPGAHLEWNESYYLCFSDRRNRCKWDDPPRIQTKQARGDDILSAIPPGWFRRRFPSHREDGWTLDRLEVGGNDAREAPHGSWHYSFQGMMAVVKNPADFPKIRENPNLITAILPATMNLKFHPIQPIYEYSENMTPESLEIGKKSGDEHWEQMAKITDILRLGSICTSSATS